ncbi:MAG TPA: hypothetical protein VGB37_06260 [Candidatus Lokiarchaeia archaeon]
MSEIYDSLEKEKQQRIVEGRFYLDLIDSLLNKLKKDKVIK